MCILFLSLFPFISKLPLKIIPDMEVVKSFYIVQITKFHHHMSEGLNRILGISRYYKTFLLNFSYLHSCSVKILDMGTRTRHRIPPKNSHICLPIHPRILFC